MTTTAPRGRTAAPEPEGDPRRGFAAVVPLRRIFAEDNRDALLLIGATLFLVGFGLVMVLSASSVEGTASTGDPFAKALRQALFAAIGIPLMLIAGRMPVSFWKRWAWPVLIVGGILQLLVFIPGFSTGNGFNTNWVTIGGFTFQPSEFIKLALILWIASIYGSRRDELGSAKRLLMPVGPVAAVAIGMVLLGKDLGTASIMFLVVFGCAYFAGARIWHLVIGVLVVAVGAMLFAATSPSRVDRITAWMNGCTGPEADVAGACWQSLQGTYGLANGGILGVGLGNSRSKWNWLPEADNDFIFAIIGEELGLIGGIVVLCMFVILAITLVRIFRKSDDDFARVVTGGVLVWVVGQAFVNIAVVLGLLPVLGVPLPLISSGGSSLVAVLIALGVVLSFTRERRRALR